MEKALPKGWVETELENVSSRIGDGLHGTPVYDDNGKFYFINGNNLSDGIIEFKPSTRRVSEKEYLKHYKELTTNTVLVSINGTLGKTAFYNNEPIILGKSACYINLIDQVLKTFLRYHLKSDDFQKYAEKSATGTTIKNVPLKAVRAYKFPLPPKAEQERIVAKLDALFGELEKVKTSLANIPTLLKNFRQAVLTQAVTGKLTQEWRVGKELGDASAWRIKIIEERNALGLPKRTPGLEYEEVTGGFQIPESWTFGYLQNFGEFTRGKSKHRPRNDKKLYGGSYPFIQTGEVSRSKGLIDHYTNTYSEFGLSQSRLFPKGTLCITIAANIAETGILDFDACFPDSVVGYLPYKDYFTAQFAMFCLMTMQKDLEHFAPATAQKNINLGILFEVPFPVPSKQEQQEIVRRVEALFAQADAIEARYAMLQQKIEQLPQAILAKVFRGELVPQLPTDGDAKELLEKIKKLKVGGKK